MTGEFPHKSTGTSATLLTGMLQAIGSPEFAQALLRLVESEFGAKEVAAYALDAGRGRAPRPIVHASRLDGLPDRVDAYCAEYHRHDRIWPALAEAAASEMVVLRQAIFDSGHAGYHTDFGLRAGLGDMISAGFRQDGLMVLNLYWPRGVPVDAEAHRRFGTIAVTLMAAILAHHDRCSARTRAAGETKVLPVEQVERLLRSIRPDLPVREYQVCARTVVGMTALGIALDLGVSVATVTTYRRRAYKRMGICSAFELFAPLISSCDMSFWDERRDRLAA